MTISRTVAGLAGAVVALAATAVLADDEHWLNYRTSVRMQQVLGDVGGKVLSPTTARPKGVELPELNGDDPVFAKWSTPMAASGHVWLMFDRSKTNGQYDMLYIDSNGDGSLADEKALAPHTAQRQGRGYSHAQFAPVGVSFKGEDGPVAYALGLQLYERPDGRHYLRANTACWYEGRVKLAGKMQRCRLIDYNCNGAFDDSSMNFAEADRIRLGVGRDAVEHFVGKYMQVDGVLLQPELARDGATIALKPAEGVELGSVQAPEGLSQLTVGGEGGLLRLDVVDGSASLPVGKWAVYEWRLERKDENGKKWQLVGKGGTGKSAFDVEKGNTFELAVGEPLVGAVSDRANGKQHNFSQSLKGQLGESVQLTRDNRRPSAPKLRIVNNDGTYDRTFNFAYG